MKKPANEINPDDAALFRATVGEVQPLPEQNRIEPHIPPRHPPHHTVAAEAIPDTLSDHITRDAPDEFLANGLSRMTLRKMRRGAWPIQDRLDLHGLTSDAARTLLQEFLHEATQHGLRCVLVIHGKGMNSPGGEAVLRRLARHWLLQRGEVLAYCDAPQQEGGSGAALVLLKSLFQ
ncbi:MAG: hypothetical protein A2Z95_07230 [Gallionellales bacterium GWA2_60_18]|nr:MAG: hypothetical protein A2Z95_07230 [Gallionellales bacterium GWA2_60_18]